MRWLVVVLLVTSCAGEDCAGLDDPEELWPRAARVRVDVFGPKAGCLQSMAGAPILSRLYAPSERIVLDLPDGEYTIVLSLFADGAATQLLGSACEENRFGAGSHTCLRFHLQSAPDGGITADGAPAPGCSSAADCALGDAGQELACCAGRCVDLTSDAQNCGGCGVACGQDHTLARCADSLCSSACQAGWASCARDAAGCGTNLAQAGLKLCGSQCVPAATCCSDADCAFPPAPAACFAAICSGPGGECSYPMIPGAAVCGPVCCVPDDAECANDCSLTCALGHLDCNGDPADGCECQGAACCSGGCQVKHDDGVGQSFWSCAPLGTFDVDQASAACAAFTGDPSQCHPLDCGGANHAVCSDGSATACDCWIYAGSSGRVRLSAAGQCNCKNNGTSVPWN